MEFKKIKNEPVISVVITATCLDCDWQDDMENAETDYCGDYDEFRGENIPTKICPKCGGGVEMD